jgi:hypothetical protein
VIFLPTSDVFSVHAKKNAYNPEIRYFFYLTNVDTMLLTEVVGDANECCQQENLIGIGQLQSGMNALRMLLHYATRSTKPPPED